MRTFMEWWGEYRWYCAERGQNEQRTRWVGAQLCGYTTHYIRGLRS